MKVYFFLRLTETHSTTSVQPSSSADYLVYYLTVAFSFLAHAKLCVLCPVPGQRWYESSARLLTRAFSELSLLVLNWTECITALQSSNAEVKKTCDCPFTAVCAMALGFISRFLVLILVLALLHSLLSLHFFTPTAKTLLTTISASKIVLKLFICRTAQPADICFNLNEKKFSSFYFCYLFRSPFFCKLPAVIFVWYSISVASSLLFVFLIEPLRMV